MADEAEAAPPEEQPPTEEDDASMEASGEAGDDTGGEQPGAEGEVEGGEEAAVDQAGEGGGETFVEENGDVSADAAGGVEDGGDGGPDLDEGVIGELEVDKEEGKEPAQTRTETAGTASSAASVVPQEMDNLADKVVFEQAFKGTSRLPDARDIEVDLGNGAPPVIISLTIEHDLQRKPYYGGYRHKITGVEYHHATCQTEVPPKPKAVSEDTVAPKFHRETQTKKVKEMAQQAVREFGTQMTREDHFVDARGDYYIEPRAYKDSEEYASVRVKATIVVQCYARGMFARQLARQSRAQLAWNRQYFLDQQVRERREREEHREREVQRRMHPKNGADFEILYNELEAWRIAETQKIETGGLEEEERQAARYELLLKEIKLVQTIDKLKADAMKKMTHNCIAKELVSMAAPKLWEMSDGSVKEVQTPATRRAKELADLYQGLTLPKLRVDERLDVLLHVKWTVKEYNTKLSKDLTELIDREADLLNRGRSDQALEGLRKRITRAFLQLIRDPAYNPEAASLVNPVPL